MQTTSTTSRNRSSHPSSVSASPSRARTARGSPSASDSTPTGTAPPRAASRRSAPSGRSTRSRPTPCATRTWTPSSSAVGRARRRYHSLRSQISRCASLPPSCGIPRGMKLTSRSLRLCRSRTSGLQGAAARRAAARWGSRACTRSWRRRSARTSRATTRAGRSATTRRAGRARAPWACTGGAACARTAAARSRSR